MSPLRGPRREQGHGPVPAQDRRQVRHDRGQDNENLYLIYSDDLYSWDGGAAILRPRFPWEFVQIGNCGSPVELDEGWLLLTHGVGPVRKYSIGAVLLDKTRSVEGARALARAAGAARTIRARGLCPQRRLHVRRDAAQRPDHFALCGLRHLLQFRDDQDRRAMQAMEADRCSLGARRHSALGICTSPRPPRGRAASSRPSPCGSSIPASRRAASPRSGSASCRWSRCPRGP